jgi:membrane protein YdbS with pleckstrin-like domain
MNTFEIERKLSLSGFSAKDMAALRRQLGNSGSTYPALLRDLNIRFIASMVLALILAAVWIYTIMYNNIAIISYSITMLIVAPIFYIFTPMKLGYKAFRYMRKN